MKFIIVHILLILFSFQEVLAQSSKLEPSWSLPVVEIETENHDSILDKEHYVRAIVKLLKNKGDTAEVLALGIKGRGNSTWKMDKKPYKLKFEKKIDLTGGGKSKHYALLCFADGQYAYWDTLVGFELSRRIGLSWTPTMIPVELILNGDYQGLYFIVENIRVEKNRVNIVEQKNGEEAENAVTGGWLLEIDNTIEENQIYIYDKENKVIRFTYHSPDSLSQSQYRYLESYLNKVNKAVMTDDYSSTEWESYIDMEELTKFYIIQEVMDNPEGFAGSCWLSKDRGEDTKIKFGPVWDLGQSFVWRGEPDFITNVVILGMRYKQRWLTELLNFPRFQNSIRYHWYTFKDLTDVNDLIESNVEVLKDACIYDHKRWPQYNDTFTEESANNFLERYLLKVRFLKEQWNETTKVNKNKSQETKIWAHDNVLSFIGNSLVDDVKVVQLNGIISSLSKLGKNSYSLMNIKNIACILYTIDGVQYSRRVLIEN